MMAKPDGSTKITVVAPDSEEFAFVIALSKKHQATLGQLPFEAFRAFADDRRMLSVWAGDDHAGYVIYRMRRRTGVLVLVHLCVDKRYRGLSLADGLLDHICAQHPFAPGLAAWCREDYPAHRRWPSLGFERTGERIGKNRAGKKLVHWWRPINELTLFTYRAPEEGVPAAAIDTNVFRDIVEPRYDHPESIALGDAWLIDCVELVTSGQLHTEVEEASASVPALRNTASRFRRLAPSAAEWRPIFQELKDELSPTPIEDEDLRQIAQACAGDARYFVTRDGKVLGSSEAIEAITGVQVLRPIDLALRIHAAESESTYRAEAVRECELEIRHPVHMPTLTELVAFSDHDRGERSSDLARSFEAVGPYPRSRGRLWELASTGEAPIALAATSIESNVLVVHALRIRTDRDRLTFARQMLHRFREEATMEGVPRVNVLGKTPAYLEAALIAEGYVSGQGGWIALCQPGIVDAEAQVPHVAPAVAAKELAPEEISHFERVLWPLKILTGKVPTYIVPIQPVWARALFGAEPMQPELLPRPNRLGVAREHVYYRSFTRRFTAPARLLWWVSGGGVNGGMRAFSWLEETVSARPRTLHRRFGTQGIYSESDVESLVRRKGGEALALVFSRTEPFHRRISLADARLIFPPMGGNGYLQSSQPVDEHVFGDFYRIGTEPQR
jgi:hypothetical protein